MKIKFDRKMYNIYAQNCIDKTNLYQSNIMPRLKSNLTVKESEELQKSVAKDMSRNIEKTIAEILDKQKEIEENQKNDN